MTYTYITHCFSLFSFHRGAESNLDTEIITGHVKWRVINDDLVIWRPPISILQIRKFIVKYTQTNRTLNLCNAPEINGIGNTNYNWNKTLWKKEEKNEQRSPETNYNRTTSLLRQRERLCLARRYNFKRGKWTCATSPELLILQLSARPLAGRHEGSYDFIEFFFLFAVDFLHELDPVNDVPLDADRRFRFIDAVRTFYMIIYSVC